MITYIYTIEGDRETVFQLTAVMNEHNVAIDIDFEVMDCDHENMMDALYNDIELVASQCIDGGLKVGDLFTLVLQKNGEITFPEYATDCAYNEVFACTKTEEIID